MRRTLLLLTSVLFSAALQTAIFPVAGPLPFPRAQLSFVALTPWFLVLLQLSNQRKGTLLQSTLLSYACGILWYAGHCYWIFGTMHQYGHLSQTMASTALLLFCLYLGLYHALYGCLAALLLRSEVRYSWLSTPLLLAALWVTVEFARAHVTSFPWNLLGYSQIDNAALMHLAPWAGTYAISFIVALCNAMLACGLFALPSHRKRFAVAMLTSGTMLMATCAVLGATTRAPMPAPDNTAVLLQPNLSGDDDPSAEPRSSGPALPLEGELAALTEKVLTDQPAARSIHLILWPEAPTSYELHQPQLQSVLTGMAAQHNATVIADANAVDADAGVQRRYRLYNSAGLFTKEGLRGRYDKIHLVPFGEFMPYASLFTFASGLTQQVGLFDRGTRRVPLTDGIHHYGVFICYESIFPEEVRQLALKGADVLVNLSDDGWYGDTSAPFQHSNMARMRAIENRRWLLRDTNTGITESIDPYGNVRATAPRHQRLALALPFAYTSDLTFYTRHGDLFAWLCTALTAAAILFSFTQRCMPRPRSPAR